MTASRLQEIEERLTKYRAGGVDAEADMVAFCDQDIADLLAEVKALREGIGGIIDEVLPSLQRPDAVARDTAGQPAEVGACRGRRGDTLPQDA